jgi:hypothetical protein
VTLRVFFGGLVGAATMLAMAYVMCAFIGGDWRWPVDVFNWHAAEGVDMIGRTLIFAMMAVAAFFGFIGGASFVEDQP